MKNLTIPCVLMFCAGCGIADLTTPPQDTLAQLEKSRDFLKNGDPDSALLITDELLNDHPNLREARLLAAEANLALVQKGRGAITESFLQDATRHYKLALRLDGNDPGSWMNLSGAYYQMSQFENGRDAAREAVLLWRNSGETDELGKALLRAADNEMQIFVAARREELAGENKDLQEGTARKAQAVLTSLEAAKLHAPGPAFLKASLVYRWLNRTIDELDQLERGIHVAPDDFALHNRLRDLRVQRDEHAQYVATYRAWLRDDGPNTTVLYSLGIAESALGDKHRKAGNRDGAQRAYLSSIKSFEKCLEARPEWKDNCNHWLAIEHVAIARMNQEAGEYGIAKEHLKRAFRRTPRVLETDTNGVPVILDGFQKGYIGTLAALGDALQSGGEASALRESLDLWEEFIELHGAKRLVWIYNNAALSARDLGTAIERRGQRGTDAEREKTAKDAMALYERSYELYSIAAELAPHDARIVNDTGLMLIYHLHRDYDHAMSLFDQAIEAGKQQMATFDETTAKEDRQLLEEAIGDAYQNKGKLFRDQGKPLKAYEGLLKEAIKYYPYNARNSARWLRVDQRKDSQKNQNNQNNTIDTTKKPAPDPRAQPFASVAEAAKRKAAENDFDGALLIFDQVAQKMSGYPPFHYYTGLYSLRYAEQAIARGGSQGQIEGLFADARNNLQRAVELDREPIEPRLHLAEANYASGEFVNAAKIAQSLFLHITSRGGTTDELLAATHKVRAEAATKIYIQKRQAKKDDPAELQAARNAFRNLEKMGKLDVALRTKWAGLEHWAGDKPAALAVFSRAAAKTPNDTTLLNAWLKTANQTQQSPKVLALLSKRDDAIGLWYVGMAHYYSSFEPPARDKPEDAIAACTKAIASFEASAKKNQQYKANCDQMIATCQGMSGFIALDAKQYDAAEKHFLAAAKTDPARLTAQISGTRSVKQGIEWVVYHHYQEAKDLPAAIATLEKACKVIPDDAGLANNLGLFARDHGVDLERDGKTVRALAFYETSCKAYKKAVRLEPESIRQRNDLVVMLLYHLKRELPYAKKTLEQCIVDGEKKLAEDPPGEDQTLKDFRETVGDCYQNLGYYLMTFDPKDLQAARKNLQKSLTFHPFRQRRSARLLRQLDRMEEKK